MPIYEYYCPVCESKFEMLQSMRSAGADCARCDQPAQRAISMFAAVTTSDEGELGPVAGMGGCHSCAGGGCACAMD